MHAKNTCFTVCRSQWSAARNCPQSCEH